MQFNDAREVLGSIALPVIGLAVLILIQPGRAAAQMQWEGIHTSNWTNGLNWNPVGPPALGTHVLIDTNTPNDPTVNGVDVGAAQIHIGLNATAALEIINGATLASESAVLGDNGGSAGAVLINGAGSEWNVAGSLYVGDEGTGLFIIMNGAAAGSSVASAVARATGSEGTVSVAGPGSSWSTGFLSVGERGSGSLDITASGHVSSSAASVGHADDALGMVAVDGAGSTWNVTSGLLVGDQSGTGMLSITGGGTVVTGGNGILGVEPLATGSAVLDGSGSSWEIAGALRVGRFGAGSLNIGSEAAVLVVHAVQVPAGLHPGSQGELVVNGRIVSVGGLFVNPNGLLAGIGEVAGDARIAGGVLAPGVSVGALDITGDLLLHADATLDFEFDGPLDPSDKLNVGGNLLLDGTLQITDLGGVSPGVYTLIQYSGLLTDNGLAVAGLPPTLIATVDVSVPGQVNLVVQEPPDVIFADRFEP